MAARCASCGAQNDDGAQFCGQCGRALSVAGTDPLIGELIADRYRVMRSLDEGGMSRVYVADQRMGRGSRDVALKVLRVDLASDPGLSERFAREVELLGQLQHPNVVSIFDHGELPDGQPFMVMELVAGRPLSDVVDQEAPLPPERVEQIAIQIASALAEAHERGIIHRDLKPHNIMLGAAGPQKDFVKVLDFGIARRVHGHELRHDITMKGTILGTPPYMAPEQFQGVMVDARTDIYALGIVLYELYTGELPLEAKSAMAWATQHLTIEPKPFEETAAGAAVPERARRAVMHALRKSPDDRPPSMLAFIRELAGHDEAAARLALTASGRLEVSPSSAPPVMSSPDTDNVELPGRDGPPIVLIAAAALVLTGLVILVVTFVLVSGANDDEAADASEDAPSLDVRESEPTPDASPARHGFQSVHHVSNASDAQNALSVADGRTAELRRGGLLTLEIARGMAFEGDRTSLPDLFVTVADDSGPYRFDISADHHHFETLIERATGSVQVDVDQARVERPRFVRFVGLGPAPLLVDAVEVARVVETGN
jgi:serine/threonine protein kinase